MRPLPGSVTIPAGKSYALITISPLDDSDSDYRYYDTVVLSLLAPPTASNSPATYSIGSPHRRGRSFWKKISCRSRSR